MPDEESAPSPTANHLQAQPFKPVNPNAPKITGIIEETLVEGKAKKGPSTLAQIMVNVLRQHSGEIPKPPPDLYAANIPDEISPLES